MPLELKSCPSTGPTHPGGSVILTAEDGTQTEAAARIQATCLRGSHKPSFGKGSLEASLGGLGRAAFLGVGASYVMDSAKQVTSIQSKTDYCPLQQARSTVLAQDHCYSGHYCP